MRRQHRHPLQTQEMLGLWRIRLHVQKGNRPAPQKGQKVTSRKMGNGKRFL
jgi:hypothetical protein